MMRMLAHAVRATHASGTTPRGRGSLGRFLSVLVALGAFSGPALAQRKAEAPWWERSWEAWSNHYLIRSDLSRPDAQAIARHLDTMYEEFSRRLTSLPPRAPVTLNVYLFEHRRDYELTLRARFGVNAAGTGGMFFTTGNQHGLALWTEHLSERRIRHVLQHEGFHQFAWSRFGGDLPSWVNEGLAEFFGLAVLVDDTLIIGQAHERTLDRLTDAIERKQYTPFDELIAMSNDQWMHKVNDGDAAGLYDQAWSMVQFLVYGDDGRYTQAFEHYLRLINNGLPAAEAFFRAFETKDTAAFEARWKQYVLGLKPSAFATALERIEFLTEGSLELQKREIYPESLDELKEALQSIAFTYSFPGHSRVVKLDAADDENFEIPSIEGTEDPPVFVVARPNLRRMLLRERKVEETHPSPSIISTEHLEPRELHVEWRRDDDDPSTFSYQIRVR